MVQLLKEVDVYNPHVLLIVVHCVNIGDVTQMQRSCILKHLSFYKINHVWVKRFEKTEGRRDFVLAFEIHYDSKHHDFFKLIYGYFVLS